MKISWTLGFLFLCDGIFMKKVSDWKMCPECDEDFSDLKAVDRFKLELAAISTHGQDERTGKLGSSKFSAWSQWAGCGVGNNKEVRRRRAGASPDCLQEETRRCNKRNGRRRGRRKMICKKERQMSFSRTSRQKLHRGRTQEISPEPAGGGDSYRRNDDFENVIDSGFKLEKQSLTSSRATIRERGFTKWSRWSNCSDQCLTYRKRRCRRPSICGHRILRETAYCYIEGSHCEKWITTKLKHSDNVENYIIETISHNKIEQDVPEQESYNAINSPEPDPMQCGQLYAGKSYAPKNRLWSMMRIIGGRESPRGKWPWQVVVLNKFKEAFCGGTLVSMRWVLTAAHCVRKKLFVRIGEHNLKSLDENEIEMRITEAIIHPAYDPDVVDNDVAMLRLPYPASSARGHGTACLPAAYQPLPMDRLCTIAGWGKRRVTDDMGTDVLHEAQVPIVTMNTCRSTYFDYLITANMFCAGYRRGRKDSCAGDSGGPLLCRNPDNPDQPWTIFGVTSFGDGCGKKGKYGIYTRVPNYVKWINRVLKMNFYDDQMMKRRSDWRSEEMKRIRIRKGYRKQISQN